MSGGVYELLIDRMNNRKEGVTALEGWGGGAGGTNTSCKMSWVMLPLQEVTTRSNTYPPPHPPLAMVVAKQYHVQNLDEQQWIEEGRLYLFS